jgi:hypothetical protein
MTVYRVVNGLGLLLFVYSASVQLNDPDPVRWVTVYGITAVLCAWAIAYGVVPIKLTLPWAILTGTIAFPLWWYSRGTSHPMPGFPQWGVLREETVRESIGLALCALWSTGLAAHAARRAVLAAEGEAPPPPPR